MHFLVKIGKYALVQIPIVDLYDLNYFTRKQIEIWKVNMLVCMFLLMQKAIASEYTKFWKTTL